jgi:5-methylcytosine-specific restriction endonuclease McrA
MPHWRKRSHPASVTVDHLTPRCNGGGDDMENLVASCARCNTLKGAIEPERFERILQHLAGDVPELGTEAFRELAKALAHCGG